jgi:quinol monooxygenase YgiN
MNEGDIYELARLRIKPESRERFVVDVEEALEVITADSGCRGGWVLFGIEEPDEPRLLVRWESVEAHERFRMTPEFRRYRETIAHHFVSPPTYRHYAIGPGRA